MRKLLTKRQLLGRIIMLTEESKYSCTTCINIRAFAISELINMQKTRRKTRK